MNPERFSEVQETVPSFVEAAFKRADDTLARNEVPLDSFSDTYPPERIAAAKQYVANLEARFNDQRDGKPAPKFEKYGKILEAIIHELITDHQMFGEGSYGMVTSKLDDIKNGVDEVIVIEDEGKNNMLGLAIDFTFGDPSGKLDKVITSAQHGKLAKVEYCHIETAQGVIHDEVDVPRVIVGMEEKNLLELIRVWQGEDSDRLKEHPSQLLLMQEIIDQLDIIGKVADARIKESYSAPRRRLEKIFAEKKKGGRMMGELRTDRVYLQIKDRLTALLNEKSNRERSPKPRFLGGRG